MRSIIFDSSAVITLAMNNLLFVLEPLRKKFGGVFYIPSSVKAEIIDSGLASNRFRLEALQILAEVEKGNLVFYDDSPLIQETKALESVVNTIFTVNDHSLTVLHAGEIGALVLARTIGADAVVIDERTTRLVIESPTFLRKILQARFHSRVSLMTDRLRQFQQKYSLVRVIRSTELALVAYELGALDTYLLRGQKINDSLRHDLLEGVLWALRIRGCSLSETEIDELVAFEEKTTSKV